MTFSGLCVACHTDSSKPSHKIPDAPSNTWQEPKMVIIGHRGASALRPEHTLAAYQKAIDDGADFIEPDLVSTQDGYLIARHENEIGGTTNVSTLNQFASRKANKTIDDMKFTGWFTEDFSLQEIQQNIKARERIPEIRPNNTQFNDQYDIPTLDQIIQLAEQHYKKTGKIIGLYIETKHPTYFKNQGLAMEDRLIETLSKYEYTRNIAPVYLQSFEVNNLKYMQQKLSRLKADNKAIRHAKIVQLYDQPNNQPADLKAEGAKQTYLDMAMPAGLKQVATYAQGVGPSKSYIISNNPSQTTTSFVKDAHQAGLKVHPYTLRPENHFLPTHLRCNQNLSEKCKVGALAEFQLFFEAGVDGVFTDDPALGREAYQRYIKAQ